MIIAAGPNSIQVTFLNNITKSFASSIELLQSQVFLRGYPLLSCQEHFLNPHKMCRENNTFHFRTAFRMWRTFFCTILLVPFCFINTPLGCGLSWDQSKHFFPHHIQSAETNTALLACISKAPF